MQIAPIILLSLFMKKLESYCCICNLFLDLLFMHFSLSLQKKMITKKNKPPLTALPLQRGGVGFSNPWQLKKYTFGLDWGVSSTCVSQIIYDLINIVVVDNSKNNIVYYFYCLQGGWVLQIQIFDYFVDLSLIDPHGFISWFVEHKSWMTSVGPSILFQENWHFVR